jgi:hypothetical protein
MHEQVEFVRNDLSVREALVSSATLRSMAGTLSADCTADGLVARLAWDVAYGVADQDSEPGSPAPSVGRALARPSSPRLYATALAASLNGSLEWLRPADASALRFRFIFGRCARFRTRACVCVECTFI